MKNGYTRKTECSALLSRSFDVVLNALCAVNKFEKEKKQKQGRYLSQENFT